MKASQPTWLSYTYLLLAQLMVAIGVVASKALLHSMSAAILLVIRFAGGTVFMLVAHYMVSREGLAPLRHLNTRDWIYLTAQSMGAGAFFGILILTGLHYTSASVAGIITSTLPAIIVIFSVLFLKESLTRGTSLCILLAIVGLVIVNARNINAIQHHQLLGDLFVFLSLLPEGAYYILSKKHQPQMPHFLLAGLLLAISVPPLILYAVVSQQPLTFIPTSHNVELLATICLSSSLFYFFWFKGSPYLDGSQAGLTTAFMPIATLILASLCLGEHIGLFQGIGMGFVLLSIFANSLLTRHRQLKSAKLT